jgi:hypothetical protein
MPHRAAVDKKRQETANPTLNSGDGCSIPRQPRRNSSISFTMAHTAARSGKGERPVFRQVVPGQRDEIVILFNAVESRFSTGGPI